MMIKLNLALKYIREHWVKILEVADWLQVSNQKSQLKSTAARVLKLLQASSSFFKFLEAAARAWISGNWNQGVENKPWKWCILLNKSLNLLDILQHKSPVSLVQPAEHESAAG